MLILGIESSCDETSAAVVRDGRDVLSNIVWSQVKLHAPYGGVVPELASRAHVRNISTVADLALKRAGVALEGIDAIAVTRGPGLVGSLLVGLEFAKALAFARRLPLVAVHHIAAHLHSPFLRQLPEVHSLHTLGESESAADRLSQSKTQNPKSLLLKTDSLHSRISAKTKDLSADSADCADWTGSKSVQSAKSADKTSPLRTLVENQLRESNPKPKIHNLRTPLPRYPYLGLAISGGHTSLTRVEAPGHYRTLGETRDDAVGEAYDKVAKLLGLSYPGGPILDSLAHEGNPRAVRFPRPLRGEHTLDFSFSGLKTAVLHHVEKAGLERIRADRTLLCDIAASFQAAVIDSLLEKTLLALRREQLDSLAVVGGVACNAGLREALHALRLTSPPKTASVHYSSFIVHRSPFKRLWVPPPFLCTDNAAMIAGLGYHLFRAGRRDNDLSLNADPGWELDTA